jgi:hypothetical protein
MCLTLRSLVIKLVSFFGGLKWTSIANEKVTNLITKLLKVRHMSRPEFFYLGPLISCFETKGFERVWPPHEKT